MKIELKNVQIAENLSEETTAFTASIYINGKRVGRAENRGHGDPINFFIQPRELYLEFVEYCKSLPPVEESWGTVDSNAEIVLGDLVEEHREQQWIKRQTRRNVIFRREGQDRTQWNVVPHKGDRAATVTWIRSRYTDVVELHGGE